MSTLDEIRKKLQAMDTRKGFTSDKLTYPHWNIPEGTSCTLRLLPDGNSKNALFWVERQMIRLEFRGIKGHDENKLVNVQVPCIEMWDGKNTCPILNEVRPMWKDKTLEDTARRYWVKKTYYSQGFVKQDGLGEQEPPENPIRKFAITPQIYKIMYAALMDPDMENNPVDYINGSDLIIAKTSKGGFADYGTSKWARKESSLTESQLEAIEKYGLPDLSTYLPARPTSEQMNAMFEMFQASLDGDLYDPAQWSKYYKPFGFDSSPVGDDGEAGEAQRVSRPAVPAAVKTVVVEDSVRAETVEVASKELVGETAAPAAKTPQEILAMLRNRNKAA